MPLIAALAKRGRMDAIRNLILTAIKQNVALKQQLLASNEYLESVAAVGRTIARAFANRRKLFLFGNGGSAADAQHIAAELNGRFSSERPALPAWALTCNTSSLTAIANDYSFEVVFARQIQALGAPDDVAVAISTSGNSRNVLEAVEVSRKMHLTTVGLTGASGRLGELVDHCIRIPSKQTPRIQEAHILTGHIICEIVEHELFSKR